MRTHLDRKVDSCADEKAKNVDLTKAAGSSKIVSRCYGSETERIALQKAIQFQGKSQEREFDSVKVMT